MIHIYLKDGSSKKIPKSSSAKDLAEALHLNHPDQALAAVINGVTKDLSTLLNEGDRVDFLDFSQKLGKDVFWHTSAHVLAQAVLRLYKDAKPTIGPPIENGFYYDFANLNISDADLPKIEEEMKRIIGENHLSERKVFESKEEALKAFENNEYKKELIEGFDPKDPLTGYKQGEFFDLCRGPHLYNLGKIKALKLMKLSGAYWKGDSRNEMLTRIYGITFPDRVELKEYLTMLEEAKKRDHKILGPKLGLFSLQEEASGMPFIHPKGMIVWNALLDFIREKLNKASYVEIKTPVMLTRQLWETSGHWQNYRHNMFTSEIEKHDYAIKPMNCPGCMLYYASESHSYRDLPLRVAEIGNVHRYEASGALSGLFRVRSFHQDDAHIFMKPEDIQEEILKVLEFADDVYKTFGLEYRLELSTKPEEGTIGSDEDWAIATDGLRSALEAAGRPFRVNEGDGAFYGPKIDFHIKDALKRTWQCGTVQLDMSLPERFELEYNTKEGTKKRPIMIHRAIFGSVERFFGILIEHFAGKFPLWLSPRPIRLLPVADRHLNYSEKIASQFKAQGFQIEIDDSNESLGKKVRSAQLDQVNYIVTIGDQEVEHETVNVRTRDNIVHGEVSPHTLLKGLIEEKQERSLKSLF
jgi:threonyl-tRNA synthetase